MRSRAASSRLPGSVHPAGECVSAADTCNYARWWRHSDSETMEPPRKHVRVTETLFPFKYPSFLRDLKAPFCAFAAAQNSPALQQI